MSFIVTIVHVFVSLFLMLTVLLQAGKGGGMGATFGGGSSQGSVFGGSGAGNFLSRLTTASAALFMLTSMTLAFLASTTGEDSLKKFSAQQRAAAAQKQKLDREASESSVTPDDPDLLDEVADPDGLTDHVVDPDAIDGEDVDVDIGVEPAEDAPEVEAEPRLKPAPVAPTRPAPAPADEPEATKEAPEATGAPAGEPATDE